MLLDPRVVGACVVLVLLELNISAGTGVVTACSSATDSGMDSELGTELELELDGLTLDDDS